MPKQETKLKAFIVTYYVDNEDDPRSCAIIAYNKEEAGDIFIRWLKAVKKYDRVTGVVCQRTRRTRKNAHMINKDFYDKQNAFVEQLEAKHGKADA